MLSINGTAKFTECTDLNSANSTAEQCELLLTTFSECSENGWIDYTYLFYCQIGAQSPVLPLIISSCILFILFIGLGTTADEFLCPSLLSISKSLKLEQGIVGVTFLAFGNGASDIVTSFAGISQSRPELVIGELFGGGVFITTIVFGSILIHYDFKIPERPFIRDVMFFIVSCYFAWAIVYQEAIHLWQVIFFMIIYLAYIICVLLGRYVYSRTDGRITNSKERIVESMYTQFSNDLDASRDSTHIPLEQFYHSNARVPSVSITVSPDVNGNFYEAGEPVSHVRDGGPDRFSKASVRRDSVYDSTRSNRSTSSFVAARRESSLIKSVDDDLRRNRLSTSSNHSRHSLRGHYENIIFTLTHSDEFTRSDEKCTQVNCLQSPVSSSLVEATSSPAQFDRNKATKQDDDSDIKYLESLNWWQDLLVHLQPFSGDEFHSKSLLSKAMTLLRCPFYILLTLTVPVVDGENYRSNWCRLLNCFHCISGPLFLVFVGGFIRNFVYEIPIALIAGLFGLLLAVVVLLTSEFRRAPVYHFVFSYLGFLVSVCWTYTLASEVVGLLKSIGMLLDVSDVILGLTILALGNCLGDFVANFSMARQGFPRIGVSACFGGPLMNLLLGTGIPYAVRLTHTAPEYTIAMPYPRMLSLLIATLTVSVVTSVFFLIGSSFKSSRVHGFILIIIYIVYIISAVLIELEYL